MRTLTPEQLVEEIQLKLRTRPRSSGWSDYRFAPDPVERAVYTLIVGAGFSYGVIPLTRMLMHETIGGYYIPDQDQSSMERPPQALQKHSASFWAEFNEVSQRENLPGVEIDSKGLPTDPGAAYQRLFSYEGVNALFRETAATPKNFLDRLLQQRTQTENHPPQKHSDHGTRFVRGFLRYVLSPESEHGWGSTGRNDLNSPHLYLAALLEAQQMGHGWSSAAFCRTIFTTNFDTLLQVAMQKVKLLYLITDRPERGFDPVDFPEEEEAIHLVYTHGSILRHNPASAVYELKGLAEQNIKVLRDFLQERDVITIGYSGWDDGLMAALRECDASRHKVYWCDVVAHPDDRISDFLKQRGENAAYVCLASGGADGLMRKLYESLIGKETGTV